MGNMLKPRWIKAKEHKERSEFIVLITPGQRKQSFQFYGAKI